MMRMEDVLWGALSKMLPELVFACGAGLDTGLTFAGTLPDRKPFLFLEFIQASWGGRPNGDGIDALSRPSFSFSNTPAELVEVEQPLMIEEYSLAADHRRRRPASRRASPQSRVSADRRRRDDHPAQVRPADLSTVRAKRRQTRDAFRERAEARRAGDRGVPPKPESTEGRPWGQPLKKPAGAPLNLG